MDNVLLIRNSGTRIGKYTQTNRLSVSVPATEPCSIDVRLFC